MKNCKWLLATLMVLLMASCQKEATVNLEENTRFEKQLQAEYEKYLAEHDELYIEYTTLEELNKVYIENGLEPVTLEELGVTEEEYAAVQARVNNPEFAQDRCNAWYWFLIDMNGDGNASIADLVLAQNVILGIDPPSAASENFGTISYWWVGSNPNLSTYDITIANQMILGIITC